MVGKVRSANIMFDERGGGRTRYGRYDKLTVRALQQPSAGEKRFVD